ncbi:hypothetical protein NPIL_354411 [Nephila pilipes]|uniref:Uncharacterized protein n=1 Tax=Nephila pilipes TaxID=299642 RepID=A0A8X6TH75_NEPPI|nr:hypothetical protein NPIL_354411 [Nephila pilipes]
MILNGGFSTSAGSIRKLTITDTDVSLLDRFTVFGSKTAPGKSPVFHFDGSVPLGTQLRIRSSEFIKKGHGILVQIEHLGWMIKEASSPDIGIGQNKGQVEWIGFNRRNFQFGELIIRGDGSLRRIGRSR